MVFNNGVPRLILRRGLFLSLALLVAAAAVVAGLIRAQASAPTVTSLSTRATAQCAHDTVTIYGSGFQAGYLAGGSVKFTNGGQVLTSPHVTWNPPGSPASDTQASAEVPAGAVGDYSVTVTIGGPTGGESSPNPNATLSYLAQQPSISSVSPNFGPEVGHNTVTVNGFCFVNPSNLDASRPVTFGGLTGTLMSVNENSLTVAAPAASLHTGTVDVVVHTANADQVVGSTTYVYSQTPVTAADHYTYIPAPTIASVTPGRGPAAGGQTITITGTDFASSPSTPVVTVGGTQATNTTVIDSSHITAVTPAHAAGTVDVVVTNWDGQAATAGNAYSYVSAPTVSSVSPNAGPASTANAVTISGTGFFGGTSASDVSAVTFGSASAAIVSVSDTSIVVNSPTGQPLGTVHVQVTTTGGRSTTSPNDQFTFQADPPTITKLSPNKGPQAGNNTVTITGTNFQTGPGTTTVTFNGAPGHNATNVVVVNSTTITATVPAGTGQVSITLVEPDGQSFTTPSPTSTYGYTYSQQPAVSSVSPSAGKATGGNAITVLGSNFDGAASASPSCGQNDVQSVTFGNIPAASFTYVDCNTLSVVTPAATGVQDIRVTTDGGTSTAVPADQYTFQSAPTITNVNPASGSPAGTNSVTITGTSFTSTQNTPAVTFGGSPASNVTVTSPTTITATVPAHTVGIVDVVLTNGDYDQQTATLHNGYSYVPTVTRVSPSGGFTRGGARVVITGSDFVPTSTVMFDTTQVPAGSYSVDSPTQITVTANPAHAAGTVDVTVTSNGATSPTSGADKFTYYAPIPTVSGVAPGRGPTAGGNRVVITGTGFYGVSVVNFGHDTLVNPGVDFTVDSDTQITVPSAPAWDSVHDGHTVDVVVQNNGNSSAASANDHYTFVDAPTVTALSPAGGSTAGGNSVQISGTGFDGATGASNVKAIRFGTVAADLSTLVFTDANTISIQAPAGSVGTVDVTVTTDGGTSATGPADQYAYSGTPGAPTAVTATGGDRQAVVSWTAPADNGSPITGYTVTPYNGTTAGTPVNTTATSATVTGLTNGTTYTFRVTATNANGTSPAGVSNAVTLADRPNAPAAVSATAGDQQASVSWTAPADNGSPITSYTVTPYAGTTAGTPISTTGTSATLTGLTNGTTYTFQVTATNARGTSPAGVSNAVTPAAAPSAPARPTATAGALSATVSWTAPASHGSPITGYTVTASPGGNHTSVPGNQTSATLSGLSNGTPYTFTVTATNAAGTSPASPASDPVTPLGFTQYHSITPVRVLDTRPGSCVTPTPCTNETPLGAGETRMVDISGPLHATGVRAVVVNITTVNPTAASFLAVWPSNLPRPNSAFLNWNSGEVTPNLVQVAVGPDGKIAMFSPAGTVDVVMDVAGYFVDAGAVTGNEGLYNPVAPNRLLDTRNGAGAFGAGESRALHVTGGAVPTSGVSAVVLNVTATNTSSAGNLVMSPSGGARPNVANVNWGGGQTRGNRVTVAVGSGGNIDIYNVAGTADVIVDLSGYYTSSSGPATGYQYVPLSPVRVMETRNIPGVATPTGGHTGPLGDHETFELIIPNIGDGPTRPAKAFTANVAVANTTTDGFLTAYDSSLNSEPNAADINWAAGHVVSADLVTKLGGDTGAKLANHNGSADVIVDLDGWYG